MIGPFKQTHQVIVNVAHRYVPIPVDQGSNPVFGKFYLTINLIERSINGPFEKAVGEVHIVQVFSNGIFLNTKEFLQFGCLWSMF